MLNKTSVKWIFNLLFTLIGIFSLVHLILKYGWSNIETEVANSGFKIIPLLLSFLPTLLCYSLSWFFSTSIEKIKRDQKHYKTFYLFFKYTLISLSWNNMTPFLKLGGEPLKYIMLCKHFEKKEAMASTTNYNVIHILATILSFLISSLILVIFYKIPEKFYFLVVTTALFCTLVLILTYRQLKLKAKNKIKPFKLRMIKIIHLNFKIMIKRLNHFFHQRSSHFFLALFFDTLARFMEGLSFYLAFSLINHPISFINSCLLDVGRTLIDTLFFFIPFQMGAREEGVRFFMKNILTISSYGFLTSVLLYRLVEIFWIALGYLVWISGKRSTREFKVKSAELVS